jgi:hypothetical protein
MNEIWRQIEGDTEKDTNWQLVNYEFPFPDDPIIKARELECSRFKRIQQSFVNKCQTIVD